MKPRKSLSCVLVLAGVILMGWLLVSWTRSQKTTGMLGVHSAVVNETVVGKDDASANSKEPRGQTSPAGASAAGTAENMDPANEIAVALSHKNVPISFWGKVVDESAEPLSGVRVVSRIRHWNYPAIGGPGSQSLKRETFTDAGGNFQIVGGTGDVLTIETVDKVGYRLSPRAELAYSYGSRPEPFHPDPSNPVVLRMWRLRPGELLKTAHLSKMIPYDGSPIWVDLLSGAVVDGTEARGDLEIRLKRVPLQVALTNREPFDWEATITGISGGSSLLRMSSCMKRQRRATKIKFNS